MRSDVRQLLCLLTKDNRLATEELNNLLTLRIVSAIKGHLFNTDFVSALSLSLVVLGNLLRLGWSS